MNSNISVWIQMQDIIENSELDASTKSKMLFNFARLKAEELHVLIVGVTGSGKSSTINAIFNVEKAKVGYGPDPKTKDIMVYQLDNLFLHDTPGLGDDPLEDAAHKDKIIYMLNKCNNANEALVDIVLVIVDGSSRDLGTTYDLINNTIIPNFKETDRILVAINQCDLAMKGKGWNYVKNCPGRELEKFLKEKVISVKRRIKDGTGIDIEPIYYSALTKYNISKLLSMIVRLTPVNKRIIYKDEINDDDDDWDWHYHDKISYQESMKESLEKVSEEVSKDCDVQVKFTFTDRIESACSYAKKLGEIGEDIGSAIPLVGGIVGKAIGSGMGAIIGFFKKK